jgi:hypothetical protein
LPVKMKSRSYLHNIPSWHKRDMQAADFRCYELPLTGAWKLDYTGN